MNMRGKPYNGHKNWNHWNVSLWISNDELYRHARFCRAATSTLASAVALFLSDLDSPTTPDGAKYTKSAVAAALKDILE